MAEGCGRLAVELDSAERNGPGSRRDGSSSSSSTRVVAVATTFERSTSEPKRSWSRSAVASWPWASVPAASGSFTIAHLIEPKTEPSLATHHLLADAALRYRLPTMRMGLFNLASAARAGAKLSGKDEETSQIVRRCLAELDDAPTVFFGGEARGAHARLKLVIPLQAARAAELEAVRAQAPARFMDDADFELALGVDFGALMRLLGEDVTSLKEAWMSCARADDIPEVFTSLERLLGVGKLSGFARLRGGSFAIRGVSKDGLSESFSAVLVLGSPSPRAELSSLAAMFGVTLPELDVDGRPMEVDAPELLTNVFRSRSERNEWGFPSA